MKNKFYVIITLSMLALVLVNTYISIRSKYSNNNIQKKLSSIIQEKTDIEIELDIMKKNRVHELNFNGKNLNKELTLCDVDNNIKKLSDIIDENKLILRYSNLNCNTCIEEQLKNISKYQNLIGIQNIILLTTYQNTLHMNKFRKINKIKIFNLGETLDKEINDIGFPYFFVLEKNTMRVNCTFVPQKNNNDLSNSYIENIHNKYFNFK